MSASVAATRSGTAPAKVFRLVGTRAGGAAALGATRPGPRVGRRHLRRTSVLGVAQMRADVCGHGDACGLRRFAPRKDSALTA